VSAPAPTARQRQFPCKNCGAEMTWDPERDALLCASCGSSAPVPRVAAAIVEHPLEAARDAARGFGLETRTATCKSCGAKVAFESALTSVACAFCGAAAVLEDASHRNALRPESVIPIDVGRDTVDAAFKKWIHGLWFRPSALKKANGVDAIGVYVPSWTFDAAVHSDWSADAGFYYTVMEPRTVMVNGKPQVRMVPVQKVRWEPAYGQRDDAYDDVLVHASRGLDEKLAAELGGFELGALVPYRPEYLAGWRAEEYGVDLESAWKRAQGVIVESQERRCSGDVPGDTQRNLSVQNRVSDVRWKLVLLPVWTLTYRFQGKSWPVLIHGQTGHVVGQAPISWWKIGALVLGIGAAIALVLALTGALNG
jgi:predicted RNA-binding Zn-ribbon protein involved in translation (DUF1610 family)